jgi:hypothetical protein
MWPSHPLTFGIPAHIIAIGSLHRKIKIIIDKWHGFATHNTAAD